MSLLPVEPAYRLAERSEENRWLVTGLWSEQAVGIVGGEPKCCKSFLALDIAVAVAQIVQADAQARIAGAALLPIIDLNGNAQHSQQSKTTGSTNVISVSRSGASVAIIQNNLQATLAQDGTLTITTSNDAASATIGTIACATEPSEGHMPSGRLPKTRV